MTRISVTWPTIPDSPSCFTPKAVSEPENFPGRRPPASHHDYSDADIANIINYERSSWGNHGASVTLEQVAAERAKGN